jgi:hypothetical protein
MQDFKTRYLNIRFVGKIFLGIVFLGAILNMVTNTYELVFSTYLLKEGEVYSVDTFRLQGKAFYNGGGKYDSPSYDFKSTNGYTFTVNSKTYQGIVDKKQFADTFSYHDLKFIAYSDSVTVDTYKKSKKPIHINALQLQVGSKKYISVDKINEAYRHKLVRNVALTTFLFLVILVAYLVKGKVFA